MTDLVTKPSKESIMDFPTFTMLMPLIKGKLQGVTATESSLLKHLEINQQFNMVFKRFVNAVAICFPECKTMLAIQGVIDDYEIKGDNDVWIDRWYTDYRNLKVTRSSMAQLFSEGTIIGQMDMSLKCQDEDFKENLDDIWGYLNRLGLLARGNIALTNIHRTALATQCPLLLVAIQSDDAKEAFNIIQNLIGILEDCDDPELHQECIAVVLNSNPALQTVMKTLTIFNN